MKLTRIITALAAPLLLTGCLLQPGTFNSEMTVLRNGDFSFTYRGEIQVAALNSLLQSAVASEEADFEAACFDEEGEDRECSAEEAEEQRIADTQENEQILEIFQALLPGLNAGNEESISTFTARLERMKGWNSVTHKGNGIFDIDYAISAKTDRNFLFPLIEQFAVVNPFVVMTVRKDGKVRIEGTGFKADQNTGGLGGLAALTALRSAGDGQTDNSAAAFVTLDGTFTVRTDGEIFTNNTQEGPIAQGEMRLLQWRITKDTAEAPASLIQL